MEGSKRNKREINKQTESDYEKNEQIIQTAAAGAAGKRKYKLRKDERHSSLYTGVSWFADEGKWLASAKIRNVQFNLGLHSTQASASAAYEAVARAREDIEDLWDGFASSEERAAHIKKIADPAHEQRIRTSRFRGVLKGSNASKYRVKTRIEKIQYSLGCYVSEDVAASVYNKINDMRVELAAELRVLPTRNDRIMCVKKHVAAVVAQVIKDSNSKKEDNNK
ncbi:hypothetical protein HK100_000577 [Physocladia obscura]|uniref:AP2 domain-containing protein n=1 Tax=Physocladia obscura TaxID=109957 RepID=A0AAD5SY19_9FUNG|nr:hypothetical protein HK100_000577 [Physocladia obscura]